MNALDVRVCVDATLGKACTLFLSVKHRQRWLGTFTTRPTSYKDWCKDQGKEFLSATEMPDDQVMIMMLDMWASQLVSSVRGDGTVEGATAACASLGFRDGAYVDIVLVHTDSDPLHDAYVSNTMELWALSQLAVKLQCEPFCNVPYELEIVTI